MPLRFERLVEFLLAAQHVKQTDDLGCTLFRHKLPNRNVAERSKNLIK